ncbi:MAG: NAD(P)/FAD-dependent oxidoreductase [Thermoplasmata archaeon]|uniref:NAD(P)/FAD-dependent oxidoreductase n=1 Tax=Candidatus Sysuiplasma superficiale TaxID=2823368 RepID=A0A8J7YPD2_9ARCH|nr:NAD(P)/FAD-dependent oxidoreductase [Candidatus Sysuiplasma superficiale]MBX8643409.1 NAD(P)/FAD-dependent oxidoreductase [Candidatus Sysuiplasma superficiale]
MRKEYDIVVAGAGPAGSRFAYNSSKARSVLVLEDNFEIGKPVQCSGLVSPRVIEMSGLEEWFNVIRSVVFRSPSGTEFSVSGKAPKGYVIDRSGLDILLAERAARAGADISLGSTLVNAEWKEGRMIVRFRKMGELREVSCSLLVGADGMASTVSRIFGLSRFDEIISCVQSDVFSSELNSGDAVRLYFGKDVAPGFFAWAIPGGEFTRVGLGTAGSRLPASAHFQRFLKMLGIRNAINLTAGPIPIGNRGRIAGDGVMLVGDAAGQAKPISGGGIFTGMAASDLAARIAMEAFDSNDFSADFLSRYEIEWKHGIGRELERAALIRKVFLKMSDRNLDSLFRTLEESQLKEILSRGDIDFPTELSPLVLSRAPSLLRFSPQLIRALI